ncbi:MAG: ABC transporter permease, partial [Candidatus Fermentibacteraceae bacterium]|nr:ABC transporter permease [Candidatus Fermentibacteraceae bacterium]
IIESTTNTWMGDAQIHRDGFRETARTNLTIRNLSEIQGMLASDTTVVVSTGRLTSPASLQSSMEMKPVTLIGVDYRTENRISVLETAVDTGSYLSGDSMEIVLGYKLAEDMDLALGDITVVTAAMADSGFSSRMFQVSGICRFGSDQYDRYTAFVNIKSAENLLGLQGELHEIAVRFHNHKVAENMDLSFYSAFSTDSNVALGWPTLAPQVHSMIKMANVSLGIQAAILFGLVLFGIINSLFMSVFERMYEFGVMRAIGSSKNTVAAMVLLEAFWLGVAGSVIGTLIGFGLIQYFAAAGISFGEVDFSGVMFDKPIYTVANWHRIWIYPVSTLVFTTLAGIYPGIHAANLNPSKAIRRSL